MTESGNKTESKKRPLKGVRELKTYPMFQAHINSSMPMKDMKN